MITLLMARHGETDFNMQHRLQGQKDVPLSPLGMKQALMLARYLREQEDWTIDAVYASPLARARMTAGAIADSIGLPVHTDHRLMEIDVGSVAGLTWDEAAAAMPGLVEKLGSDVAGVRYPGGENVRDVLRRSVAFLDDLVSSGEGGTFLVVAHAVILKCMLCEILGLDVSNYRRMTLGNASLSVARVRREQGRLYGRVSLLNDVHYLKAGEAG